MDQLVITATFTAEPIERSLDFWLTEVGRPQEIKFAPYNQVFQQLLDPTSLISRNQSGTNIVLLRFEDLLKDSENHNQLARIIDEFVDAVVQTQTAVPILIAICPASPDVTTNLAEKEYFAELEGHLVLGLEPYANATVVPSTSITTTYPVQNYYDAFADHSGHVPYTPDFFAALSATLVRKLHAIQRAPYKVVVLDCDNTLWQGVCGEDGADGITPYQKLQEFMVAQYQAGMLLCLCSKNVEEDVFDVFEKRDEMPLHMEHLVAWKINWEPKSQNIAQLAQELQLGLDSFIFLDDNPLECAEVRANCPEVLTLQIPTAEAEIDQFLAHAWPFDRIGRATSEDQSRTQKYRDNVAREQVRSNASNLNDFLDKLELKVKIDRIDAQQIQRVAQMTQRTNQFNFTTKRYSETDVQPLLQSTDRGCLVADVSDRFGDYGLVGATIFEPSTNALEVDTFLLSCRVLGRKVEEQLLSSLGEIAVERNLEHVNVRFKPTAKNQPALDFVTRVGEQFKETTPDGFLYRMPSEYAKNLVHTQDVQSADSTAPADSNASDNHASNAETHATTGANQNSKSELFQRIASELRDPATVQQLLQAQVHRRPELMQPYVAPQSQTETAIAQIWRDVLYIDQIGINDQFVDLGGGSLQLVQVYSKLKSTIYPELGVTSLFNLPTIGALAKHMHQQKSADATKTQIHDRATRQKQAMARRKQSRKKVVR